MMLRQPENTNIQEAADCRTENKYEKISKNSRQHGFVPIQSTYCVLWELENRIAGLLLCRPAVLLPYPDIKQRT